MNEEQIKNLIADALEAGTPLKYECRTNYMVAANDVMVVIRSYLCNCTDEQIDELANKAYRAGYMAAKNTTIMSI